MLDENYRNVKQRIHKHTLRRHVIYISSSAAAVCLFILLLFSPESSEKSPVFAQLNDMGVSISEQKVQFMIGDSIVANLNTSAKMNINPNAKTTLQSATGEEIALQEETPLKIYVPAGKRFDLELTDGTHVWLNSDTWLEYPATFASTKERRVKSREKDSSKSQTGCHETLSRRNSRRRIHSGIGNQFQRFSLLG